MKIEHTFQIKGRGTVLAVRPTTQPHQGSILRHADGRLWLITGVEIRYPWRAGDAVGLLIRAAVVGQADPIEGDEVEMVEPLSLAVRMYELERELDRLREECARLGVVACDAKWDLMP